MFSPRSKLETERFKTMRFQVSSFETVLENFVEISVFGHFIVNDRWKRIKKYVYVFSYENAFVWSGP